MSTLRIRSIFSSKALNRSAMALISPLSAGIGGIRIAANVSHVLYGSFAQSRSGFWLSLIVFAFLKSNDPW